MLGTKLAGQTQRFYFDTKSGVILPGDTLKFPFVFKSPNAGIFTETWELMTRPTLCGGAPIRITLRGNEFLSCVSLRVISFRKFSRENNLSKNNYITINSCRTAKELQTSRVSSFELPVTLNSEPFRYSKLFFVSPESSIDSVELYF